MSTKNILNQVWIAFIVVVILLTIPTLARSLPYAPESFLHGAVQEANPGLTIERAYTPQLQELATTPYDAIVISLSDVVDGSLLVLWLPIFFALCSLFLLYFYLRDREFANDEISAMYYIAILSPTFIIAHTFNNAYAMVYFLQILSLLLFERKKFGLAILPLVVLSFFGPLAFGATVFYFLVVYWKQREKLFEVLGFPFAVFLAHLFLTWGAWHYDIFFSIIHFSSELGALRAPGVFLLVLAVVGWSHLWKSYKWRFVPWTVIMVGVLFFPELWYVLFPFVTFLGMRGIWKLYAQHWYLPSLKDATIFVLILGILFSGLSYEARILDEPPTPTIQESLTYLLEDTPRSSLVLTHPTRSIWVEAESKRRVLLTRSNSTLMKELFHTYDLDVFRQKLDRYDVTHILIDEQMKTGLVWERENQEILYLLTDERHFEPVFVREDVVIYEVLR